MLKRAQYWLDNLNSTMVHEIAKVEGIILELYYDSAGVATWSVGITSASGHNVERYRRNPSTLERALEVYVWLLKERYGPRVVRAFGNKLITKEQFTAALSFDWNTGGIHRATWVQQFKVGEITKAKRSILNWKTPPEIIGRRKHERDLFFGGSFSGTTTMTQYDVRSNLRPNWSSARKIDVSAELAQVFDKLKTPQDVAKDAAAEGRQSSSQRAIEGAGIGTAVIAAEENVQVVNDVATTVEGWTGWDFTLIVCLVVVLVLAYVYRERIRKLFEGRKARKMIDMMAETEAKEVHEIVAIEVDPEEAQAIKERIDAATT
jgi:lysozyme